jgi:hypothetical protein
LAARASLALIGFESQVVLDLARRHARAQSRSGERLDRFIGPRMWIPDLASCAPSATELAAPTRAVMTTHPETPRVVAPFNCVIVISSSGLAVAAME